MKRALSNQLLFIALLSALGFLLSACGSSATTALPLADDRPTFIYFYTDN